MNFQVRKESETQSVCTKTTGILILYRLIHGFVIICLENKADHLGILQEATIVKCQSLLMTLTRKEIEGKEVTRDTVTVSLMADLQQLQEKEIAKYVEDMQEMVRH